MKRFKLINTRTDRTVLEVTGNFSIDVSAYPQVTFVEDREEYPMPLKHELLMNRDLIYLIMEE